MLATAASSAEILVELGRFDESLALGRDLAPRLEEAGDVASLLGVRSAIFRVLTRRGELVEAADLSDWIIETAREIGETQGFAGNFPGVANLCLSRGTPAEALALLSELEAIPNVRDTAYYPANLPEAVRTALAAGDPELARRLSSGLEPILPLHEHALATAQALLLEQAGEHAEGANIFSDAAERWASFEMPWERAHALLGRGRCLLALGKPLDADAPVRDARDVFTSLGAKPALAQTDDLLLRAASSARSSS